MPDAHPELLPPPALNGPGLRPAPVSIPPMPAWWPTPEPPPCWSTPWMTTMSSRNGSSGERIGDSTKSVSPPVGVQSAAIVPHELKNTTKRSGYVATPARARWGIIASSNGSAARLPNMVSASRRVNEKRGGLLMVRAPRCGSGTHRSE